MSFTFMGYVPFYNNNGALMCTVPCFDTGVPFVFGNIESPKIGSADISKEIFDSVIANAKYLATNELIKNIMLEYGPIFTNKDNGWAIVPASNYVSGTPITHGRYGRYENGELIDDSQSYWFRYYGNTVGPMNYDNKKSAFFFFSDIDVPVSVDIVLVDNPEYPAKVWGNISPGRPIQPKFNVDLINYAYIRDVNAPEDPSNIRELIIKPKYIYTEKNSEVEMEAIYRYISGREVKAKDIIWSLYTFEDGYFSEYDNISISEDGILSVGDTSTQSMKISAFSPSTNLRTKVQIFVDLDSSGGGSGGGGTIIPNPGNQYFPGGISGSSGIPQGSYDKDYGPNISGLVPGLDSEGQSTGQGGAVGNDISLSGMYTKYLLNQGYLSTLAKFFWEDNVGIQALKLVFGNPIDSIISLISYPFNLDSLVDTTVQNLFFGKYDSKFISHAITRSSFQIDWGTIPIEFYWGNFLDYAPYTQVQLYLPWGVGFVSIDPNEVMPYSDVPNDFNPVNYKTGSIRVVTNIELDKGACVHNVIGNRGLVIGSYGGIVGKQIPMTALDQSAKMLALLGAASGVGMSAGNAMAGAATGKYNNTMAMPFQSFYRGQYGPNMRQGMGYLDVFDSGAMAKDMGSSRAMKAGLASAAALASTPPNYPRAGTFSDATNTMCVQAPYIIISRPSQSVPRNYGHYNGYPSNIHYDKLSMVSGYTEISEIHLDNVPGSVEELEELDSMLKGGILL